MVDVNKTRTEPIEQFWEIAEDVHAGMLGVEGSGQHMQPMHPNCDPKGHKIWFFARKSSDIARSVGQGVHAHFCVIGPSHDYHACVAGQLNVDNNRAMIDRFWGAMPAAWFDGKDDPDLVMLRLTLDNGVAWGSVGAVKFGWEMLKSKIATGEPDVGVRQHFAFVPNPVHASAQAPTDEARRIPRQEGQV